MGYYIEVEHRKGKAQQLVDLHEAVILPQCPEAFEDVPENKALICVIDNGPFEAAGLCCDQRDFVEFAELDELGPESEQSVGPGGIPTFTIRSEYQARGQQRPRTWLLMDKSLAHELAGYDGG